MKSIGKFSELYIFSILGSKYDCDRIRAIFKGVEKIELQKSDFRDQGFELNKSIRILYFTYMTWFC